MATMTGSFSLPTAQRTSQLVNDTRFSSIREYVLDLNSLSGSNQVTISDLPPVSIIYRVDLIVLTPFSATTDEQYNIEISKSDDTILMDSSWNDPNTNGTYSTNCYSVIAQGSEGLIINHNLSTIVSGSAILRLYIYNNVAEYTRLLTNDNLYYRTEDFAGIHVNT